VQCSFCYTEFSAGINLYLIISAFGALSLAVYISDVAHNELFWLACLLTYIVMVTQII